MTHKITCPSRFLAALTLSAVCVPAWATQSVPEGMLDQPHDIVVTAPTLAGSVNIAIPADVVLDSAGIQSYGVSSVADLLSALSAQTRSGRGRGDGRPVVLLNGKRISGFAELRDLPSEAIQRVEILPEDVALRYGYAADQRVINFILRPGFKAVTLEGEIGGPTSGGRTDLQVETGLVRIGQKGRVNLDAEYSRTGSILESERGIVASGADQTAYRTLSPTLDALKLNAVVNQMLPGDVGATFSLQHERTDNQALLGLRSGVSAVVPLERDTRARTVSGGLSLDGRLSQFNWTANVSAQRTTTRTLTDQNGASLSGRDDAKSRLSVGTAVLSATGPVLALPAGPATINLTAGFDTRDIVSTATRSGVLTNGSIGRNDLNGRINLDIPLTSRRRAVADVVGDISINVNGGIHDLSDFGTLTSYGYGMTWSPVRGVTLLTSYVAEDIAPTPSQLGDPVILTPNALVYDYVRGETALVSITSGGNPLLRGEKRRDTKLGLTYEPQWLEGLTLTGNYFRNHSTDPVAAFPALTPVVAAAFSQRFTRNAAGQLVALDQRALNFLATRSEQLRWGLSFQKQFGQFGGGSGGGPGGPGSRGGGFGPFGGGQGGRWSVSLYHNIKFLDEIDVAANAPTLDLLGGDAVGQTGGTPRQMLELEGGWFFKGIGFRVNGAHQTATNVRIGGASDALHFSDLTTLNLRLFVNFDQRPSVLKTLALLKGTRLAIRIDNLLNDIQNVRDANAGVPVRYQRGYLDPVGRRIEVSLRKIF